MKSAERKELVVADWEDKKEFVLIEESRVSVDVDMLVGNHQAGGQEGQARENNPDTESDIKDPQVRRGSCFQ